MTGTHRVVSIETVPFNPGDWSETVTKGRCSNCRAYLLEQYGHGFADRCPDCGVRLENGTDDREWVYSRNRSGG